MQAVAPEGDVDDALGFGKGGAGIGFIVRASFEGLVGKVLSGADGEAVFGPFLGLSHNPATGLTCGNE